MSIAEPQLLTAEQLDAIPDDGVERWLINGELREGGMTRRTHVHSRIGATITKLLGLWNDQQPPPRGEVLVGEAGVRLRRNPDTTVGIDVAYISVETAQAISDDYAFVEGPPILAVEILSPSDKYEDVTEKVDTYLETGVKLIWIVDPAFRTITVYRPDAPPQLFNDRQTIDAEPHLRGFKAALNAVFA